MRRKATYIAQGRLAADQDSARQVAGREARRHARIGKYSDSCYSAAQLSRLRMLHRWMFICGRRNAARQIFYSYSRSTEEK